MTQLQFNSKVIIMNNDNIFGMCVFNPSECPNSVCGLEVLGGVGLQLVWYPSVVRSCVLPSVLVCMFVSARVCF